MVQKTEQDQFSSEWNKAAAWAQSQGIPASSYLPVYQLDSQRLQSGESPMSAGERNRAILAANNPNNVTPLPTDNPSPSSVFGNARNDLRMIATGLEPQHLITNLFDTVVNTAKDLVDPARLDGGSLGGTAANVLQDTLLSFVPGAYDIGAVLRGKSLDPLAEHPLVSLLDLLPAGSSKLLTGALADSAVGARLAESADLSPDVLRNQSLTKTLSQVLTNHIPDGKFAKLGIDPNSAAQGIGPMTLGQKFQTWAGNSKLGTSAPIQKIVGEYTLNNQLYTGIAHNILAPAIDAWSKLSPEDKNIYDEIFSRQARGDDIQRLLNDPTVPIAVRDAAEKMIRGPVKFLTEESFFLRSDGINAVRRPDGTMGIYAVDESKASTEVLGARDTLIDARVRFTASRDATDKLRQNVETIDASLPTAVQRVDQANKAARQQITQDDSLLQNITQQEDGKAASVLGTQKRMAEKIFGADGMVDFVLEKAKTGDVDHLGAMLNVLQTRLDKWGENSVDASVNPAFSQVKNQIGMLDKIVKTRAKMNGEIDRRINEEPIHASREVRQQREQLFQTHERQKKELGQKQQYDREMQTAARTQAISKARSDLAVRLSEMDRIATLEDTEDVARGDNAAARATKQKTNEIYRQVKTKIDARHRALNRAKASEKAKYQKIEAGINKTWDKARGGLEERQKADRLTMRNVQMGERKNIGGELMRQMRDYTKALDDFQRAVWDHPSDEYRDMQTMLYEQHLLASDKSAQLLDATEKRLVDEAGLDEGRMQQLREDPSRLGELVSEFAQDVYRNPVNFDPELVDAVKQAHEEATSTSLSELQTLIASGFHPQWLPESGPFARATMSVKTLVGKGIPHVDMEHSRALGLTNTRFNVVLGVTKATSQALRRDAAIDFVEHSIVPRTITGEDLRTQLDQMGILTKEGPLAQWDPSEETITSARSRALADLGLTKFDSQSLFGFTMPRYEGKALYMPSSLKDALEKMKEVESHGDTGIWDKGTNLFRMSILGLSPRYTAHILFGGTFLMGLRSTPYVFTMLGKAAKALHDGSLPQEIFRTPAQEGVTHLTTALQELNSAGGKQVANLAVQEDLSLVQKIAHGKASPIQILKSAADINYRFTRYVVKMQSAMAYLDYAARADRKGSFIDEVTGQTRVMTKERAMQEGMSHVEEVFGNLRNMSPLERQISKSIMPFYGWSRHILNYVMSFPADHPWRAMVLSLMAYENSAAVPKGLPERLQFLFFLGKPDAQGNVSAIDTRFMDPLRDIANYATLGGWLQGLNPALLAPLAILNPQVVYGSNELYPNVTYDQFYGIETAGNQGNIVTGLEQFVPQLGALSAAFQAASNYRSIANNPNQFYKSVFESLNIPFAQVQKINVKQIAAHDEIARYEVAKQASENAFDSGNFSGLSGYATVPNPLNPDYDISPAQLEAVYNSAIQEYPGTAPIEVLTPPPTPIGY